MASGRQAFQKDSAPETMAAIIRDDPEPLSRIAFEGPDETLMLTENTQPAILAVSVAAARLLESRGISPALVAGHSLGEYSANVVAGTFSFDEALRIVRRRGRYMQEAVPVGDGSMAAILGLDADVVAEACAAAAGAGVVSAANLNGPGQVVIAGSRDAVAKGAWREARRSAVGERAGSLRADEAGAGTSRPGAPRAARRETARADCGQRRRRAEARRRQRHRGARRAGIGARSLGGCGPPPCVRGRHNVC